jgi:hypothetical protein
MVVLRRTRRVLEFAEEFEDTYNYFYPIFDAGKLRRRDVSFGNGWAGLEAKDGKCWEKIPQADQLSQEFVFGFG